MNKEHFSEWRELKIDTEKNFLPSNPKK